MWRPSRYRQVVWAHLPAAVISLAVLLVPWFKLRLGMDSPQCVMLKVTGWPCPFCGFTRALAIVVEGDPARAWALCPLALLLFAVAGVVALWNTVALVIGLRIEPGRLLRPVARPGRPAWIAVTALLLANWLYRILAGLQ